MVANTSSLLRNGDLAGMRLPNPLMTASGCAANGKELHRFFDIAELGALLSIAYSHGAELPTPEVRR